MKQMSTEEFYSALQLNEYGKQYLELIDKAKSENRVKIKDDGNEFHHIHPRALGGVYREVVLLSCYEHCLSHALLAKAIPCKETLYPVILLSNRQFNGKFFTENNIAEWAELRKEAYRTLAKAHKENIINILNKTNQTKLERYGKTGFINTNTPEADKKRTLTKIARFGSKMGHVHTKEVDKKRADALRSKYGTTMGACHTPEAEALQHRRRNKTMLKKYGTLFAGMTEESRKVAVQHRIETARAKYGNTTAMTRTPEAMQKRKKLREAKNTVMKLPGFDNWWFEHRNAYYHKIDSVYDYLKFVGKSIEEFKSKH